MSVPVHFNYAGAGITSAGVDAAIRDYLTLERELGPYEAEARRGEAVVAGARASIATLLGCSPAAVALFDNATRAWGELVTSLPFGQGDTVWVSPYDYVGNLFVLTRLRETAGVEVVVIPLTPQGDLDLDWAAAALTGDVALVSVSHLPSCAGVVTDVAALGAVLRGSRAMFVVDGCQAVGNVAIDVAAIGCDVYTGAGRKFLAGPRGTGFAALSERFLATAARPVLDVHAMAVSPELVLTTTVRTATDVELAERNFAVWAGLGVALDEHLARGDDIADRRRRLLARIEERVAAWPSTRRLGDGSLRSGTCSVIMPDPGAVYRRLLARGVNTWVGHGNHTPLFAPGQSADEFLRISLADRSTADEVDVLLAELDAALS
jgi:selenocysteine lyase/cysteine desulfurase